MKVKKFGVDRLIFVAMEKPGGMDSSAEIGLRDQIETEAIMRNDNPSGNEVEQFFMKRVQIPSSI